MPSFSESVLDAAKKISLLASVSALAVAGAMSTAKAAVTISRSTTTNIACVSGICTPSKKGAILNVAQLEELLASGNVKVTTAGSKASDIFVGANIAWASSRSLTLDAYQSITIEKPVSVSGTGGLSLDTDDGGSGGTLSFSPKGHVTFLSTVNSLTIDGEAYTLVADTATLASDIAATPGSDFALASNYNATGHSSFVGTTFTGKFEGLGNSISHLSLTATQMNFGLFAQLGTGGAITNVRLNQANVLGGSSQYIGVLVGLNNGLLSGDSVGGRIKAVTGPNGGLAGGNQGSVVDCYSIVEVTANDKHRGGVILGGLVGHNEVGGVIDRSFATGLISSAGDRDSEGGLVGLNEGTISNSYGAGSVGDSLAVFAGGLAGANTGTIADSYSTGTVSGGSSSTIGGLVGTDSPSHDITNSDWDTTTSGITNLSQGAGDPSNDPGITGLSTTQLQAGLPSGFSSTIWGENASINGGLPYLLALPPPA